MCLLVPGRSSRLTTQQHFGVCPSESASHAAELLLSGRVARAHAPTFFIQDLCRRRRRRGMYNLRRWRRRHETVGLPNLPPLDLELGRERARGGGRRSWKIFHKRGGRRQNVVVVVVGAKAQVPGDFPLCSLLGRWGCGEGDGYREGGGGKAL